MTIQDHEYKQTSFGRSLTVYWEHFKLGLKDGESVNTFIRQVPTFD